MVEARRIPPTAPAGDPSASSADVPSAPERERRARVVGFITPGLSGGLVAVPAQARAAAAWRAWVRAGQEIRTPVETPVEASGAEGRVAAPRSHVANAEVLAWQNRLRLAFVGAASSLSLLLRVVHLLPSSPVAARALSVRAGFVAQVLAVLVYVLVVRIAQRRLTRRRSAGPAAVLALVLADQALVFTTAFLLASPQYYARALLLAFFSLQLTQTFFGRRVAFAAIGTTVAGYAALCALALHLGGALAPAEEAWTTALFVGAAVAAATVQGSLSMRLNRLVQLFERTEEGDFSEAYDEAADPRPDAITRAGRAYNLMRTQLSTIVLTDPLSGCLNRRGFDQQLARETARAARAGAELSLIALDVDYFKRINDTFGHLAGDAVIRETGALLRDATRTGDVVARVGGEEFMVLAPDTNAAGAFLVATRIVEAFRKRSFEGVEGRIPVTVSAGVVAERVSTPHVAEALKARADEALYAAKRGGRNRVAMWSGEKSRV